MSRDDQHEQDRDRDERPRWRDHADFARRITREYGPSAWVHVSWGERIAASWRKGR